MMSMKANAVKVPTPGCIIRRGALFAELAAMLACHANRMPSFLHRARVIYIPSGDRSVFLHLRRINCTRQSNNMVDSVSGG